VRYSGPVYDPIELPSENRPVWQPVLAAVTTHFHELRHHRYNLQAG
jgi:hypothetical protein